MKRRSPLQALASSPTMVGAITTLIVIVAVFLAYNANNGLPFVPTYRVNVDVPNAARLVQNNEVRIGGHRVGVVESITAVRRPTDQRQGTVSNKNNEVNADTSVDPAGDVVARLGLKLDQSVAPLPDNSVFRVRYKSAFGLKYLEITRGDGPGVPQGYTFDGTDDNDSPNDNDNQILSLSEVKDNKAADNGTFIDQTEFDDIGNTFDQRTRNAGRQNLVGYGDALAGRGGSLNQAIEALNPLLTNLRPVAKALIAPETRFENFFPALGRVASIVAPVSTQQARAVHQHGDHLRRDQRRSAGARRHDRGRPADARDRDPRAARPAALPGRVHEALAIAQAGCAPAPLRGPRPQPRDQQGHPGAAPDAAHEPRPPHGLQAARQPRLAADDADDAEAPARDVRQGRQAGQVRDAGADGLQLLELLDDAAARAPDREGLDRLHAARLADHDSDRLAHARSATSRRRSPARSRPASRRRATRACRRTARRARCRTRSTTASSTRRCRSCTATRPARPARTAATARPVRPATCRAGWRSPVRARPTRRSASRTYLAAAASRPRSGSRTASGPTSTPAGRRGSPDAQEREEADSQRRPRADLRRRARGRLLLRLHEGPAVHGRDRVQGRLRLRPEHARQLARADRRRRGRQGDRASSRSRRNRHRTSSPARRTRRAARSPTART